MNRKYAQVKASPRENLLWPWIRFALYGMATLVVYAWSWTLVI